MARAPPRGAGPPARRSPSGDGPVMAAPAAAAFGRQLQVEQRLLRPLLAASNPAAKRSKTSTSGFMADSSDEDSDEGDDPEQEDYDTDELTAYLEVEQANSSRSRRPTPSLPESIVGDWRLTNKATFPNLEVMARQYLGVPASSASVERRPLLGGRHRLLRQAPERRCQDGRRRDIMFTKADLPSRADTK